MGCASTSQVTPYQGDSFIVSAGDPGGTTTAATLQISTVEAANAHCERMGRKVQITEAKTAGTRWTGTSATLIFRCQ